MVGQCPRWCLWALDTELKTPLTCLGIAPCRNQLYNLAKLTDVNLSDTLANSQVCHWGRGGTVEYRKTLWNRLTDDVADMLRAAGLKLGQHDGFKGQRRHAEEEIPDAVTWNVRGGGKNMKVLGVGDLACASAQLPPDLADTAQYSALISSDSLMASCSVWYSWSGDWAESKVALKHLTYLSFVIYQFPPFEILWNVDWLQ